MLGFIHGGNVDHILVPIMFNFHFIFQKIKMRNWYECDLLYHSPFSIWWSWFRYAWLQIFPLISKFFAVHCMVISIGLGCCCYIHNIIVCYGLVLYCDTFWVSKVLLSQAQLLCRVKYVILYLILTDLSSISKYIIITWSIEIKNHAIQIKYPYKYWYLVFKKI